MNDPIDAGEYCRQVEAYLTRANGGHLVRIVGPAFDLVRQWARDGVPLRIVFRGIDDKLERHRAGRSRRPLRIEFCDADVREVHDNWRRAVGLTTHGETDDGPQAGGVPAAEGGPAAPPRPSLTKHLDRALERLGRTAGRLDLPESLRDGLGPVITELAAARDAARTLRGADRDGLLARVGQLDRDLLALARASAGAELRVALQHDAEQDLASYRGRLTGDAWTRAIEATVDRMLRDRLGLPTLET